MAPSGHQPKPPIPEALRRHASPGSLKTPAFLLGARPRAQPREPPRKPSEILLRDCRIIVVKTPAKPNIKPKPSVARQVRSNSDADHVRVA